MCRSSVLVQKQVPKQIQKPAFVQLCMLVSLALLALASIGTAQAHNIKASNATTHHFIAHSMSAQPGFSNEAIPGIFTVDEPAPNAQQAPISTLVTIAQQAGQPSSRAGSFNPLIQPWGLHVDQQLESQRELYQTVRALIERRQLTDARGKLVELSGYPLFPYAEAALLETSVNYANEGVIQEYLTVYGDTPPGRSLRTSWLEFLRKENDFARYVRDYQPQSSLTLQCHALRSRYRLRDNWQGNDEAEFWQEVTEFWVHGRSLPSACDGLFRLWAEQGLRTNDVVWQRAELALREGQTSLFRYLLRFLPREQQQLLELQRRLRANPRLVQRYQDISATGNEQTDQYLRTLVINALGRLRWNDHFNTIAAWEHYQQEFAFSERETNQVNAEIAVTLALRGEPNALAWFQRLAIEEMSPIVLQWYLSSLLRDQRFDLINDLVLAMPAEQQQQAQWLYWRGRSLALMGRLEDATEVMVQAAQERNYYGFLASARMSLPPNLNNETTEIVADKLISISQRPEAQRAREFLHLDDHLAARREWNVLRARASAEDQVYIALLASEWGWHDQAIFGFASSGSLNDVARRFPLAHHQLLTEWAEQARVDSAWVFAIARRESSFQVDAVSPVGARGLMQVMPGTADYLNRRTASSATRTRPRFQIDRPEDNVRMGTQYLAELLHRKDGNWLLATAAYNAGPNRVAQWLPESDLAADIWVEMIPYQETRDYVKAVLAYQQIYTLLLGKDANVLQPLVRMQINGNGQG